MSTDANLNSAEAMDRLLHALSEQLSLGGHRYDLIVIGGSALLALGLVSRPTQDIDVVVLTGGAGLDEALPLPEPLAEARRLVARDFGLPEDWLNSVAAADMLRLGLPEGFDGAADSPGLRVLPDRAVCVAPRPDPLQAPRDRRPWGWRHLADLRALEPTEAELLAAARWARTHDPSEGFRSLLSEALAYFEIEDADLGA